MTSTRLTKILPLAAVGTVLTLIAGPVLGAGFRRVPDVPAVPPAIDHPAERDVLVRDVEQLETRRERLIALRENFARECDQRRSGRVMSRSCQFRQVEIRRDTSRFRTDVLALRDRMRRIEEGIQRHRLEGRSYTGTARVPAQDRRFRIVRDALSVPGGTWQSVMQPFIRKEAREPNRVSPLLGYKTTQPRRLTDAYLVKLKAAFASPGPRNPFSGTLGREQLIRLQK